MAIWFAIASYFSILSIGFIILISKYNLFERMDSFVLLKFPNTFYPSLIWLGGLAILLNIYYYWILKKKSYTKEGFRI